MPHDDDRKPVWKKELSFGRDADADAASAWEAELARWDAPPSEPVPADRDPAPTADGLAHSWLTKPLEEISEPEPDVAEEPEPEAAEGPELEAEPSPEPTVAPVVQLPMPPDPQELPTDPPAASITAPNLPEPTLPEPSLPEPGVELPVDVAPELAAEQPKVPFYKREISLKRSPREKPSEKKPKAPKQKRERKPKQTEDADAPKKVPFYKRDLTLKRSTTDWEPAEREAQPKPPKAQKRPKRPRPSLPKLELPAPSLRRVGGGSKKLVGLKIGASQLAAATVVNNGSRELVQAVRSPLEHGVVVGGELRDPEALAVALKEFFRKHKLPRRGIRLGIANNRIGVRTLDVVGIEDPKQLDNAIKFRAQEVLPIPIEDAVLDYQVLSESVDADGQPSRRVLLVVAYRELVDRYVNACRKAGLQIVGIDLEAFALLRALAEPRPVAAPADAAAVVVVAVGHDRSTFAVSDGRICEFTRVLQWGGSLINIAIARALDTAPSEAEVVKRALSFAGAEEVPAGFNADQVATAREAARRELQTFARELVSSLQFYQNQPGSLSIGEIVVTGGTAHLPGLGIELERLVGVPVRIGDPLSRVTVSKKAKDQEQVGSLAVAIGLGIED